MHTEARCTYVDASPPPTPPPAPALSQGEELQYELAVQLLCLEPLAYWSDERLSELNARAALAFGVAAEQVSTSASEPSADDAADGATRRRTRRRRRLRLAVDDRSEDAESLLVSTASQLNSSQLEAAYQGWSAVASSAYAASLFFNATVLAAPSFLETAAVVAPPPPPAAAEALPVWVWATVGSASGLLLCLVGFLGYRLVWKPGAAAVPVAPYDRGVGEESPGRVSTDEDGLTSVAPPKAS